MSATEAAVNIWGLIRGKGLWFSNHQIMAAIWAQTWAVSLIIIVITVSALLFIIIIAILFIPTVSLPLTFLPLTFSILIFFNF